MQTDIKFQDSHVLDRRNLDTFEILPWFEHVLGRDSPELQSLACHHEHDVVDNLQDDLSCGFSSEELFGPRFKTQAIAKKSCDSFADTIGLPVPGVVGCVVCLAGVLEGTTRALCMLTRGVIMMEAGLHGFEPSNDSAMTFFKTLQLGHDKKIQVASMRAAARHASQKRTTEAPLFSLRCGRQQRLR